jgi:hypothetical protein
MTQQQLFEPGKGQSQPDGRYLEERQLQIYSRYPEVQVDGRFQEEQYQTRPFYVRGQRVDLQPQVPDGRSHYAGYQNEQVNNFCNY